MTQRTGEWVPPPGASRRVESLDSRPRSGSGPVPIDGLADLDGDSPEREAFRSECLRLLAHGWTCLDTRERSILMWRFGLAGRERLTLKVIGERMGLTRERVRQLEGQAISKLRSRLMYGQRRLRGRARAASRCSA